MDKYSISLVLDHDFEEEDEEHGNKLGMSESLDIITIDCGNNKENALQRFQEIKEKLGV